MDELIKYKYYLKNPGGNYKKFLEKLNSTYHNCFFQDIPLHLRVSDQNYILKTPNKQTNFKSHYKIYVQRGEETKIFSSAKEMKKGLNKNLQYVYDSVMQGYIFVKKEKWEVTAISTVNNRIIKRLGHRTEDERDYRVDWENLDKLPDY